MMGVSGLSVHTIGITVRSKLCAYLRVSVALVNQFGE